MVVPARVGKGSVAVGCPAVHSPGEEGDDDIDSNSGEELVMGAPKGS
jgi:hypothetical protein